MIKFYRHASLVAVIADAASKAASTQELDAFKSVFETNPPHLMHSSRGAPFLLGNTGHIEILLANGAVEVDKKEAEQIESRVST